MSRCLSSGPKARTPRHVCERTRWDSDGLRSIAAVVLVATCTGGCGLLVKDGPGGKLWTRARARQSATISRADAVDDLDVLIRTIEHMHPAAYTFRSREDVNADRQRLIADLPASLTTKALCVRFSVLVASLRDGHTEVPCLPLTYAEWHRAANAAPPQAQTVLVFQPDLRLDVQQHLIVAWPHGASGVAAGDRLLRVNDHDADGLLADWARELSGDGAAGPAANVARNFRVELALHGVDAPYHVVVAAPGAERRDLTMAGMPVNYLWQEMPKADPQPQPAPAVERKSAPPKPVELRTQYFNYRSLAPGIAYMDFFTMWSGFFTARPFRKADDAMFRRVALDQPRTLIIDLRNNGGGDDGIAGELFRHITERAFRLSGGDQMKRSTEARAYGKSMLQIPFRWVPMQDLFAEGRRLYLGPVGSLSPLAEEPVKTHPRAEPFFAGPVCVLTGPFTFSAAVQMADAMKTYGLATIVGEETGGHANMFGNPMPFPLPHSALILEVATSRTVRANGNAADVDGVIPDIIVHTTAEDIRVGRDPVIERAKSCPERRIQGAGI